MLKRRFGRTGYEISVIGLGCYQCTGQFGVSPEEADRLIDFAMESEINYFDTAMLYGFGESEELVARGLYRHPDKIAIVTDKVGHLDVTAAKMSGDAAYTNLNDLKRVIKHSLWVMRRDTFDIMMIHEIDDPRWQFNYDTGDSVAMTLLEDLKKEGVIKNIGIGSWDCKKMAKLVHTGRVDAVLSAGGINLLERPIYDSLIPACQRNDVGVSVGGGFGQNNPMLVQRNDAALPKMLDDPDPKVVMMAHKLRELYTIADEIHATMIELAIRFIISCEEIHCHVPGARAVEHIRSNIASADKGPLPKELKERILKVQEMGKSLSSLDLALQVEADIKI